jgi:hypothetical protein
MGCYEHGIKPSGSIKMGISSLAERLLASQEDVFLFLSIYR